MNISLLNCDLISKSGKCIENSGSLHNKKYICLHRGTTITEKLGLDRNRKSFYEAVLLVFLDPYSRICLDKWLTPAVA